MTSISPHDAQRAHADGEAVIIDVRDPFERAAGHIPGSRAMPLSSLDVEALRREEKRVIFQCRSGARSTKACQQFGGGESLAGGIEAWRAAGLPIERSTAALKLDVMRQVHIAAGSLVVAGIALGWLLAPAFLLLSLFVGTGLIFAGVSGWCGMAKLLAIMPWNRVDDVCVSRPVGG
jgi:rhodanese-related sulfurtransferase